MVARPTLKTMTLESGTVNYVQGFLNNVSGRLRTFKDSG